MAVTSTRRIINKFADSADEVILLSIKEAESDDSPASVEIQTLAAGANTITPPANAIAVTILLPTDNTELVTLKGVSGDTGIALHLTDPTSIALNSASNTFVLNAAAEIVGVRFIWS